MPAIDRELADDGGRLRVVAVFQELQQVASLLEAERPDAPIVEDQKVDLRQRIEQPRQLRGCSGDREILHEPRPAAVPDTQTLDASAMAQGAGNECLAHTCGSGHKEVLLAADPLAGGQPDDGRLIKSSAWQDIAVLDASSGILEPRGPEAGLIATIRAVGFFPVDEQRYPLLEAEGLDMRRLQLLLKGQRHAVELESTDLFERLNHGLPFSGNSLDHEHFRDQVQGLELGRAQPVGLYTS